MNSIINDKVITFKELEQKIFKLICEIGRDIAKEILESYDQQLLQSRDKKVLRCKGPRKTTIKTMFGEVEYSRNIYQRSDNEGHKTFTYLLDEAIGMDKIGLISVNLAEIIVNSVTENPYRVAADLVSSTCGQSISSGGVWNLMQSLGERITKEEDQQVEEMNITWQKYCIERKTKNFIARLNITTRDCL